MSGPRIADHASRAPIIALRPRLSSLHGPIEKIVVLRALMLGDLLCALPALRALRGAFPAASITLVGLAWARALVERLSCVDHFIALPGYPGLPEVECDVAALPDFLAQVQAQRFDLALQLHGSGAIVNPLVAAFGARHSAGFHDAQAFVPQADAGLYTPWPSAGHESERLLALTDWLGLPRRGTQLEFPLRHDDRAQLAALWPGAREPKPYVCVHAGAQLASRRWSIERFAAVADRLAAAGRSIVLTGGAPETDLVNTVAAAMRAPCVNLVGRTSLWVLGALIEGAEQVVCNDTGVSHIAAALGRPSVVISCGADVARWAPPDPKRHRVLWHDMSCRPCSHAECPYDHGCAKAIEVDDVLAAVHAISLPLSSGERAGVRG